MPLTTEQARVLHKRDTIANWTTADPLLLLGEIAFVEVSPILVKIKVGNGAATFNNLPYCGDLSGLFHVYTAVPTTNPGTPQGNIVYETATPGVYVHFPDANNNPIVVNAGEYVRIIDEGNYFTKVVLPVSVAGFATVAELQAAIDSIFDLYYASKPTRPAQEHLVNKFLRPNNGFYSNNAPAVGNWYVDMGQPFRLSRLKEVWVRNAGMGGPPNIQVDCQIVTIDPSTLAIAFLGVGAINYGAVGQITIADFSLIAPPLSAPGSAGDVLCYIAVRDTTANDGLMLEPFVGNQVWEYTSGVTPALSQTYTDTDISYQVEVYGETIMEKRFNVAGSVTPIVYTTLHPMLATLTYYPTEADSTILANPGTIAAGAIFLDKYGQPVGKVITIKIIGGTMPINVLGNNGALIDGSAADTITGMNAVARYQFDGLDWWKI